MTRAEVDALLNTYNTVKVGRGSAVHFAKNGAVLCNGNSRVSRVLHGHDVDVTCARCERAMIAIARRMYADAE